MPVLRLDCPHCPTNQVAFEVAWNGPANANRHDGWYVTALCGSCRAPITTHLKNKNPNDTSSPLNHGAVLLNDLATPIFEIQAAWPVRSAPDAPPHTPESVKRRFMEAEKAYQQHSWNAAVAMYRSALDIATKAIPGVPTGETFYNRLIWLHDNHKITPDMKAWADHVRIEGNEALHDPEDFTQDDATPLRLFSEMFLRYIFELPGEVRAFRGEAG